MSTFLRCSFGLFLLCGSVFSAPQAPDLAHALSTRYAPYADWETLVDVDLLVDQEVPSEPYWRSVDAIRSERLPEALPLSGLHLALDPGHIGGAWAATEGRHFRISSEDYWVMEGELVLEVAQLVREQLLALGAEVSLVRAGNVPVNPKAPIDYLKLAEKQVSPPDSASLSALCDYGVALRERATHLAIISGELAARVRLVNQEIQPDALISLHINAARWPVLEELEGVQPSRQLVSSNNTHALIFGCMSDSELRTAHQHRQFIVKLLNKSGPSEQVLGAALSLALAGETALPPAIYSGRNAVLLDSGNPHLLARNLMMLRAVECPAVLLEPYVANGQEAYARIQSALGSRALGLAPAEDDILVEYADAVVAGVLEAYGAPRCARNVKCGM